jgi:hypothetical protein
MTQTGWTGESPEAQRTGLPVTDALLAMKQRGPGDTLAMAQARSYDSPEETPDPDERAANLVARGYMPGQVTELSRQLADTTAQLAAEQGKLDRYAKRQERVMREHAAGRITALDIPALLGDDDGDAHRAAQLEPRAENLRKQISETAGTIAPAGQRQEDPIEAAASRARRAGHEAFVEATRARLAGTPAPAKQEPRPFDSGGEEGPDCPRCQNLMRSGTRPATAAEAAQIHAQACAARAPVTDDLAAYDAEIKRLLDLGYSLASAQAAATPLAYR